MSVKENPPDGNRGDSSSAGMQTVGQRVAEAFRFRASSVRSPVAPYRSTVRAPGTAQPKDNAVTFVMERIGWVQGYRTCPLREPDMLLERIACGTLRCPSPTGRDGEGTVIG